METSKTSLAAWANTKVCNNCKRLLDISEFTLKTVSPDVYSNICKSCVLEQKRLSRWLAFKHIDDKFDSRINEERERLESMKLVDLKNIMKFNNIPIRHLNKSEIIEVLLNTPNVNFEVQYTAVSPPLQLPGSTPSTRTPKSNIRNSAQRVKLVSVGTCKRGQIYER